MNSKYIFHEYSEAFRRQTNFLNTSFFFNKHKLLFITQFNKHFPSLEIDNSFSSRDSFIVSLLKIPSHFQECFIKSSYSYEDLLNLKKTVQTIKISYPSSLTYFQKNILKNFVKKTFPLSQEIFNNKNEFVGIMYNNVSFEEIKPSLSKNVSSKDLKHLRSYYPHYIFNQLKN